MRKPVDGNITQGFHSAHLAVDIAGPHRSPVYAPHSGKVTYAGQLGSGTNDAGLAVDIDGGTYKSRLGHNDQIIVSVGQQVTEGQQVAYQGFTGYTQPDNVVQGSHCHWVLWENGTRVDGRNYITSTSVPSTSIDPNQRILENLSGVYQRADPRTGAAIIKDWPYDQEPFTFRGFVRGEDPYGNGNNIWFVGAFSGGYFWSGAFLDKSTNGLPDLTPAAPPVQPPAPTPTPVVVDTPVAFSPDYPSVVSVNPSPDVDEYPTQTPKFIVIHHWGAPEANISRQSVINTMTKDNGLSVQYIVDDSGVYQAVPENKRAQHAGPQGNDGIGIECDPNGTDAMYAHLRLLVANIRVRWGRLELRKHSEFMATACPGKIDILRIEPISVPPSVPPSDLDQENNTLLKQILSLLQWVVDKLKGVFR